MDRVLASTRTTPSPETVAASVPESAALGTDPAGVDAEPLHKLCAKRFGQVDVPG
jgi:hypothetical protein